MTSHRWLAPLLLLTSRALGASLLAHDLSRLDENALLGAAGHARIYAIADGAADFHPERTPLLLVHGIMGDPRDLQAIADRVRSDDRQLYVLAYDDLGRHTARNGDDLAEELERLAGDATGPEGEIEIIAHSMGGIVVRRALDRLALANPDRPGGFTRIRVTAIDTPWHGYGGPSDRCPSGALMELARPLMPDGLEDMRARSSLFQGNPRSIDPVDRVGLLDVALPDTVEIELVFAARGDTVMDYTEGVLADLPAKLVERFRRDRPVRGEAQLTNFWKALIGSSEFVPLEQELEELATAGRLDVRTARGALERHYRRYAGDHDGVIHPQLAGASLLDHLAARAAIRFGELSAARALPRS